MPRNFRRHTGTLTGAAVPLARSKTTVGGWQVVKAYMRPKPHLSIVAFSTILAIIVFIALASYPRN